LKARHTAGVISHSIYRRSRIALLCLGLTFSAALARPIHIVAFGDSATAGYLVTRENSYPAQLQRLLRRKGYDVVVENAGVNGGTLAGALHRFDLAISPDTDITLVEFGTNDLRAGASMKTVRRRLTELVRSLRARRIDVLVIGLGRLNLAEVAKADGVPYAQWRLPRGRYRARDGAHFDARGYGILVRQLLPLIENLIAQRAAQH